MMVTEIQALLDEWMTIAQECDRQMNALMEITGSNPDGALFEAMSRSQDMLCRMVADKVGADDAMLADWWLTHRFGEHPMTVHCDWGQQDELTNNAQLAVFILESRAKA